MTPGEQYAALYDLISRRRDRTGEIVDMEGEEASRAATDAARRARLFRRKISHEQDLDRQAAEPTVRMAPYTTPPALPPQLARRADAYWRERRRLMHLDRETIEAIRDAVLDELQRRDEP